jgi:hypothetical protein
MVSVVHLAELLVLPMVMYANVIQLVVDHYVINLWTVVVIAAATGPHVVVIMAT